MGLSMAACRVSTRAGSGCWWVHDEHRDMCMRDDGGSDAAHEVAHEPAAAVRADHNHTYLVRRDGLDNPLSGRRSLDRHALCPEASLLRQ